MVAAGRRRRHGRRARRERRPARFGRVACFARPGRALRRSPAALPGRPGRVRLGGIGGIIAQSPSETQIFRSQYPLARVRAVLYRFRALADEVHGLFTGVRPRAGLRRRSRNRVPDRVCAPTHNPAHIGQGNGRQHQKTRRHQRRRAQARTGFGAVLPGCGRTGSGGHRFSLYSY